MKKIFFILLCLLGGGFLWPMKKKEFLFKAQSGKKKDNGALGDTFFKHAREKHEDLTRDKDCFTASFIKHSEKSMEKLKALGGKRIKIVSKQNKVESIFFDRNSEVLLVIAGGFPVPYRHILPLVKMFPEWDLVSFDYRGIGENHQLGTSAYCCPWKWKGLLSSKIGRVNFNVSGLGTLEEKDIITVVEHFKKKKEYKKVFALGFCFSTYLLARVAAEKPKLFDKMIFDGSWPSVERVIKTIIKYPSLVFGVDNPRSPIACLTNTELFQSCMVKLLEWIVWVDLKMKPMKHYVAKIKCTIL